MEEKQDYIKEVGIRIRQLREEQHLTQTELGRRTGISSSMLSLIENGRRCATGKALRALSEALGISLSYLISGERDSDEEMEKLGKRVYRAAGGNIKKIEAVIVLLEKEN